MDDNKQPLLRSMAGMSDQNDYLSRERERSAESVRESADKFNTPMRPYSPERDDARYENPVNRFAGAVGNVPPTPPPAPQPTTQAYARPTPPIPPTPPTQPQAAYARPTSPIPPVPSTQPQARPIPPTPPPPARPVPPTPPTPPPPPPEEVEEPSVMEQGSTFENDTGDDDDFTPKRGRSKKPILNTEGMSTKKKILIVVAALLVIGVIMTILLLNLPKLSSGKKVDWLDKVDEEETEEVVEPPFEYTTAEVKALRANGYTGDEIDEYEFQCVPVDRLIAQAEKERKELYDKEIAPYLDGASDEFNELRELTWLAGEEFIVVGDAKDLKYKVVTINTDYIKVPAHCNQLFLKVFLDADRRKAAFMSVTPDVYAKKSDEGNIVVTVTYCTGEENIIVTNIVEKELK